MFLLRKPSDTQIHEYVGRQANQPFSYDQRSCTRDSPEPRRGWNTDHDRVRLGHGEAVFQRAREAIDAWRMFPTEIATLCWPSPPREGLNVCVLYWARPLRIWLLFAARVVYVVDEATPRGAKQVERYGFAYGTLPDHPERGEERFLVEWDRNDDAVYYDLLAISQPRHWLARIGYPYTRYEQSRFRRLSGEAMQHDSESRRR